MRIHIKEIIAAAFALAVVVLLSCGVHAAEDDGLPARDRAGQMYCFGSGRRSALLKVVSINIRHNVDWADDRLPLIADEIARLRPDVIGVQEMAIGFGQSKALLKLIQEKTAAAPLKYNLYEHLKTGGDMMSGEGISILSLYPLKDKGFIDLGNGRVAVYARVEVAPGLEVDVYNTHLHNTGGDEVRLPQMKKISALIEGRSKGHPVVLTGDMNSAPDSKTITHLTRDLHYVDAYVSFVKDKTGPDGNTSPITLSHSPVPQNPRNRIDYIFLRVPLKNEMKVNSVEVCFKNHAPDGLYPSDHLGLSAAIEIFY